MPKFRVLQKIHIGGADTALNQNEVIGYDKKTLTREDGKVVNLNTPDALKGAISLGWIVPEASPETTFRPQPAGIEVRSAVSTKETREVVKLSTVSDEERDVGTRQNIRAKTAKGSETPTGEGRVIGNVKQATEAREHRVIREEETVVRAVATGDVQEAIAGEDLVDLLPEATSSDRPEPGVYKEKPTQNSYDVEIPKTPEARVELLAAWVRDRDTHIPPMQLRGLVSEVLGQLEALKPSADETESLKHLSPDDATITWDFTAHWKTRQKAVEQYWDDANALAWIAKNEKSRGVLKVVHARLEQLA